MTSAQEIQIDQQQQAEYFRSSMIGWGFVGALLVLLAWKMVEEWRKLR